MAGGGPVDAEQGADDRRGQVQVLAEAERDHVVEQADLAGRATALGLDAAAAAEGVEVLFAAGGERDFQRGGQGFQGLGVHAGQRGVVQGARGAAALRLRFWLGGWPGAGRTV